MESLCSNMVDTIFQSEEKKMRDFRDLTDKEKKKLAKMNGKLIHAVRKDLDEMSKDFDLGRASLEYAFIGAFAKVCMQYPDDTFDDEEEN